MKWEHWNDSFITLRSCWCATVTMKKKNLWFALFALFLNNVKLIVLLFIANVPHDWILCRILVIRNNRVQMMLPWRTSHSPQSLYFSFSFLGDTLIITSGITLGWSIFQTLQLSKYFYSIFPTRREISGCTSAHNCTVTTLASINFHIIIIFN